MLNMYATNGNVYHVQNSIGRDGRETWNTRTWHTNTIHVLD